MGQAYRSHLLGSHRSDPCARRQAGSRVCSAFPNRRSAARSVLGIRFPNPSKCLSPAARCLHDQKRNRRFSSPSTRMRCFRPRSLDRPTKPCFHTSSLLATANDELCRGLRCLAKSSKARIAGYRYLHHRGRQRFDRNQPSARPCESLDHRSDPSRLATRFGCRS